MVLADVSPGYQPALSDGAAPESRAIPRVNSYLPPFIDMDGGKDKGFRTADGLFALKARNEGTPGGWKRNGR